MSRGSSTTKRTGAVILALAILLIIATSESVLLYQQNSHTATTITTNIVTSQVTQINLVATTIEANSNSISSQLFEKQVANSFASHLQNLESLDISKVLRDYQENSIVIWTGQYGQVGGIYQSTPNISLLMSGFLSDVSSLTITNETYMDHINSASALVNATLDLVENNRNIFSFNATIQALVSYSYTGSEWLISNETWVFLSSVYYESKSNILQAQAQQLKTLSVSPDDSYLAVGATSLNQLNGTVYFVSIQAAKVLWSFKTQSAISTVAVSNNGSYVLASGYNHLAGVNGTGPREGGVVYFLDRNGRLLWNLTSDGNVYGIAMSTNGSIIAVQYQQSVLYLSNVGKVLWNYSFPESTTGMGLSADGEHVMVGSFMPSNANGTGGGSELYYFNSKGKVLWNYTISDQGQGEINYVSISSNGSYIATGTLGSSTSGIIYLLGGNGTLLWDWPTFSDNQPVIMSADASYLLVGENYGSLLYDFKGNLLLNDTQNPPNGISGNGSLILLSGLYYGNSQVQLIEITGNTLGTRTIDVLANLNITGLSLLGLFPASNAQWVAGSGVISPGEQQCTTISFYELLNIESSVQLC